MSGGPWFVIQKDVDQNIVYVSHGYDCTKQYGNEFCMKDFHFITENPWADDEAEVSFKIRHTPEFTAGRIVREGDYYRLVSSQMLQGIAPGQFGVIYDKDHKLVIGSGEIML